jgi:hypothetical protein
MVTVPSTADFKLCYPQFDRAPNVLVGRKLTDAASRTTVSFYKDADVEAQAVMLRAAILLSKMPEARKMQLVGDDQAIVWQMELYDLARSAGLGLRVF